MLHTVSWLRSTMGSYGRPDDDDSKGTDSGSNFKFKLRLCPALVNAWRLHVFVPVWPYLSSMFGDDRHQLLQCGLIVELSLRIVSMLRIGGTTNLTVSISRFSFVSLLHPPAAEYNSGHERAHQTVTVKRRRRRRWFTYSHAAVIDVTSSDLRDSPVRKDHRGSKRPNCMRPDDSPFRALDISSSLTGIHAELDRIKGAVLVSRSRSRTLCLLHVPTSQLLRPSPQCT